MPISAPSPSLPTRLWAPRAWLSGRWQEGVLFQVDACGHWAGIDAGVHTPPPGATVLVGPAVPSLVNAHSHAFQRAFAGMAERRRSAGNGQADDFWSWRDRMYGVALRISPAQLQAVAAQLYVELLRGGYTQVCEFHYLQHAPDGQPYADPACLSWSLADAAAEAGIGLTLLPVLYERAGFAQPDLREDQRRFRSTPASVLALSQTVGAARRPLVNAGVAIHSLRAASAESIASLLGGLAGDDLPIHIHVAEQTAEVDDCVAHTGQRPIEWLCRAHALDARWHLVHATHALPAEIDAVAASGAGVVICPSTEANLGDGLPDLPRWLAGGVPLTVGSDSQMCRSWAEELRWLDYGQRLVRRERNVAAAGASAAESGLAALAGTVGTVGTVGATGATSAADAAGAAGSAGAAVAAMGEVSTAARLFNRALAGSGASAGFKRWGFVAGARADLLVLDAQAPGVRGVPPSHTLDALVFATDAPAIADVYVAGRPVVSAGRHVDEARVGARFDAVMAALWGDTGP